MVCGLNNKMCELKSKRKRGHGVYRRCGAENLEPRLRKTRLRWFGHVKHRDENSMYFGE